MYTEEQIKRDRAEYLKEQIQNAEWLLSITQGTQICWEVSSHFEPSKWSSLEVHRTEQQAKEHIEAAKKDMNVELFYRPIIIDSDSGETVNFQNLHYYKKDSYFVKELNKYLNA